MATSLPIPRDSQAKLVHILRLSAQIFAERGFKGASMRDISRATGVSLSGLYYYFESKQKLLYLIQKNTFTYILDRLHARLEGVRDPQVRLRLLVQNHLEYFLSHPHEMKVLSHEESPRRALSQGSRRHQAPLLQPGPRNLRCRRSRSLRLSPQPAHCRSQPLRHDELGLQMA